MSDIFDIELIRSTLRLATPLVLAALGGIISERAGVVNIALEGMMLIGAFFGAVGSFWTGNPWLGAALGMIAGGVTGLVHGVFTQRAKMNHIVSGVALNVFALGLTTYLLRQMFQHAGASPPVNGLPRWETVDIPILMVFTGQSPLLYLAFFLVFVGQFVLWRTPLGLRIRAGGESPAAARSAGVRVDTIRLGAVSVSGLLAGLAGVYLSLGQLNMFVEGMSGGRGFIALAAVIFGKWKPYGAAMAALFFGFFDAIQMRFQGRTLIGLSIPSEFMLMLPYVVTIIVLAGFVGHATPPGALGREE